MTNAVQRSLPTVGTPIEKLIREFSDPLLLALGKEEQTQVAHDLLKKAQGSLRSAWEARRMCERLVDHADGLVETAELAAASTVRSLFDALETSPDVRDRVFPRGALAATAPRYHAQVRAIERLDDLLGECNDVPSSAVAVRITLGRCGLALSTRLRALEVEEQRLAEAQRHEFTAERVLRRSIREVAGILNGLFSDSPARRASFSRPVPRKLADWPALASSQTPSARATPDRTPKKGRAKR